MRRQRRIFEASELIVVMSVMAKWYLLVVVQMLNNRTEPKGAARSS